MPFWRLNSNVYTINCFKWNPSFFILDLNFYILNLLILNTNGPKILIKTFKMLFWPINSSHSLAGDSSKWILCAKHGLSSVNSYLLEGKSKRYRWRGTHHMYRWRSDRFYTDSPQWSPFSLRLEKITASTSVTCRWKEPRDTIFTFWK